MQEMGLKNKDLEPLIGTKGHVSAVLSGKREITLKMAQRRPVIQTKIRSLFSGVVFPKNFQQGDVFEEAEMEKVETKFVLQKTSFTFNCFTARTTSPSVAPSPCVKAQDIS